MPPNPWLTAFAGPTSTAAMAGMNPGMKAPAKPLAPPPGVGGYGGGKGPSASAGMLPFQDQLGSLGDLYTQTMNSQANPNDLTTASNLSAQDAARRGIDGPLAVTIGNTARSGVINDFSRTRTQNLQGIMAQLLQARQMEAGQRQVQRSDDLARAAAGQQQNHNFWSTAGGVIGAGVGGLAGLAAGIFIPGVGWASIPALMAAGYQVGSGIGGAGADATYTPGR